MNPWVTLAFCSASLLFGCAGLITMVWSRYRWLAGYCMMGMACTGAVWMDKDFKHTLLLVGTLFAGGYCAWAYDKKESR
jgi:hypothetical protein